jgi:hypothetical protein
MTRVSSSVLIVSPMQGVNRALPYVASSEVDDIVEVQTPILFRLVRLLANIKDQKYIDKLLSEAHKAFCKDPI